MNELDERFMARALELARRGAGLVSPNPAVGAVVVRDGRVVGEGFFLYEHLKHAEVYAIEAAGELARGATLYCSLEPCCFQGRTPPCTDALIEAGIARAVIAVADPHPRVRGRGLEQLRNAGITVEVGLLEAESKRLNEAFFKFAHLGLPFIHAVQVKAAADGGQAWAPSPQFLETAAAYDAILIESWSEPAMNIVRAALGRHRHRPLIIAGPHTVLRQAGALVPAADDSDKAIFMELNATAPAGAAAADEPVWIDRLLAPLAELRAESVLVLVAATADSPPVHTADRLTYVVAAEEWEGQLAAAGDLTETVINRSPGFTEITGYRRPRGEEPA